MLQDIEASKRALAKAAKAVDASQLKWREADQAGKAIILNAEERLSKLENLKEDDDRMTGEQVNHSCPTDTCNILPICRCCAIHKHTQHMCNLQFQSKI